MERAVAVQTHEVDSYKPSHGTYHPKPGYEALDAWLAWTIADPDERGEEPELPVGWGEVLDYEDTTTIFKLNNDNSEDGESVWYVPYGEISFDDSLEAVEYWNGYTWPRLAGASPEEPQAMGIRSAQAAYNSDTEDTAPDDAADQGVADLLDDPQGWCRFVPDHWDPGAWVDAFRASYEAEWREKQAE